MDHEEEEREAKHRRKLLVKVNRVMSFCITEEMDFLTDDKGLKQVMIASRSACETNLTK